jgi:hypothetical protein
LAFPHHADGGTRNLQFFFAMQLLLFPKSRIFQCAPPRRQSAAVAAMDAAAGLQSIQILSDGDLGCAELFGQVHDQNAAVATQDFQDLSASFFVQQSSTRTTGF